MGIYLNPGLESLRISKNSEIYVDKSMLISYLHKVIDTESRFVCVSRPRRFGKTMAGNMIAAYYSKDCDSKAIFSDMKISKDPSFEKCLNKFNVIKLDINPMFREAMMKKEKLSELITKKIVSELSISFPLIGISYEDYIADAILKINQKTHDKFIFIIDEYDVVIRENSDKDILDDYLNFLIILFKNADLAPVISLVYLTGIIPIVRDKVQSKLNNFEEFTMVDAYPLEEYAGFSVKETQDLCIQYGMDFDEIKRWYDGYNLNGVELYSPRSVVTAIKKKKCSDYWTQTGSYEALRSFILMNMEGIKDDIISMISGARVHVNVLKFLNTMNSLHTKDDVFTYLIHIGYLAYDGETEECYIPNYEIKTEWINSIEDSADYKSVMELVNGSKELLHATWNMDSEAVARAIEKTHMEVTSNLTYNNEGSFQSAIRLSYFYADSYYTVVSELPSGKGFADIVFIPYVPDKPAIIVELKRNTSVQSAIDQIRQKEYPDILKKYKDNLLLVGVSYSEKSKKHSAIIEKA